MDRKPRTTMMDVAARAGVSQATVSLVLNENPGVRFSLDTREKVLRAVQDLGYAHTRKSGVSTAAGSRLIIVMVDEIVTDPWMSQAFHGIRDRALEAGITATLHIGRTREIPEVAAFYPESQVVGYIYGTILTRSITAQDIFRKKPSALVNCYDENRQVASVLPGDVVGGRSATLHLLERGRRRIAYIGGEEGLDATLDRRRGYEQALSSHNLSIEPDLTRPGNWEPSSGYEQTHLLMDLPRPPDAIFCANDLIAMGCYDALRERGLSVPGDVAVVGFDDREIAQFMHPPLTTLALPQYEMGTLAAELVLDQISGLPDKFNQLKVDCPLIVRDSA